MKRPSEELKRSLAERSAVYHESLMANPDGEVHRYLTGERGLSAETLKRFRLGEVTAQNVRPEDHDKIGYISIPYVSAYGVTTGIRFRNMPDKFGPKYHAPLGQETGIYNVAEVTRGGDWIAVAEGEIDTMTLAQCGIPAIGIAGANGWKQHFYTVVEGFDKVIICGDSDGKGDTQQEGKPATGSTQFIKKISEAIENPVVFRFPDGFDPNGYFVEYGAEGLRAFLRVED